MERMRENMELRIPPRLEFSVEPDISVSIVEGLGGHYMLFP